MHEWAHYYTGLVLTSCQCVAMAVTDRPFAGWYGTIAVDLDWQSHVDTRFVAFA